MITNSAPERWTDYFHETVADYDKSGAAVDILGVAEIFASKEEELVLSDREDIEDPLDLYMEPELYTTEKTAGGFYQRRYRAAWGRDEDSCNNGYYVVFESGFDENKTVKRLALISKIETGTFIVEKIEHRGIVRL
ncbi:MAG: uncharacterized protein A8A55_2895 [Amphiamblys sp. WSBS2006]|nr:MAG: uncharacterized protein A8A55_2895 [Amphiamblys sp. WSBS2006]